jgi:hypothetical protein
MFDHSVKSSSNRRSGGPRVPEINAEPKDRATLEALHEGQVWDTRELVAEFVAPGFAAPFIVVRRKRDGVRGSLEFQATPRYCFNFVAD